MEKNYYEILGVKPGITIEELKEAFDKIENKTPEVIDAFAKVLLEVSIESKKEEKHENFEDIFSNSKKNLASVLKKAKDIITSPTAKKIGKDVIYLLPTVAFAGFKYVKFKLQQDDEEKDITEIKTDESRLENQYREKLEYDIEKRLSKSHFDSKLEITKIKYENQIELLQRKIYMKENQVVKKGKLIVYKLELTALKKELSIYEEKLKELEQILEKTTEKSNIPKLQEELIKVTEEIEKMQEEPEKRIITIKKLNIQQQKLADSIKRQIDREKSKGFNRAIFQQEFIHARVNIENFFENVFVPAEKIDEKSKTVR